MTVKHDSCFTVERRKHERSNNNNNTNHEKKSEACDKKLFKNGATIFVVGVVNFFSHRSFTRIFKTFFILKLNARHFKCAAQNTKTEWKKLKWAKSSH